MQKYLEQYIEYHLGDNQKKIDNQLIILPSKRSVSALKNAFAVNAGSLWLPQIIDIITFIENVSELKIIEHNQSVLEFYEVYLNTQQKKDVEAFENFYSWASVLIADFNEIDRFLIDPEVFFEHRKALKEMDYFGEEKTEMIKSYIRFWEDMPKYYYQFKLHLQNNNNAYQGLAYRRAAENIDQFLEKSKKPITFLGFNALNSAEEYIIESCLKKGQAKIGWDIDKSFLEERQHPSNIFIKKYQKKWEAYKNCFIELNVDAYKDNKNIRILSSPKSVGQAKSVAEILKKMSEREVENTAIILNDENLLTPILNSIPKRIESVNITMGLPLIQSPITDFFSILIEHHKSNKNTLDYNFLKKLFEHDLLNQAEFFQLQEVMRYLMINNLKSINLEKLKNLSDFNPEINILFKCLEINITPLDFTSALIEFINISLALKENTFRHFLIGFKNVFTALKTTLEEHSHLSFMAFNLIFKEKIESEKLSFKGSKLKGLQIMGMLETRLLDFENVILTSVNEGILPSGKTDNSYITYNLKKEYGLPTHTEKDAVYAYHFFRLLQRAKKCFLIYDNDQSGFNKGEQSRFITYLQVFKSPNHQLTEEQFSLSTQLTAKSLIEIEKTPEILSSILDLAKSGFSPTALTTYILNPILFYKRYILKVKETEQIEDVISHKDFGTLIHNTLENMYNNIGYLDEQKLEVFKKKADDLLKTTFEEVYAKGSYHTGANRIQLEIAKAYLIKFFEKELQSQKKSKTEILSIEETVNSNFKTSKNEVVLKGKIDRVDKHAGDLRIIDLKTGKVEAKHLKFNDFENVISDYDYSKAFQILFYALLYHKKHQCTNIKAGIISFKNLSVWFMPLQFNKIDVIDQDMLTTFEGYLGSLIDEILDPNIPFKEKEVNFGT
jgi:hypothetical protein